LLRVVAVQGVPLGLNGSLDEFSIQDILQILSLGRKTGILSLETPAGGAAILVREGRIVAVVDGGCPPSPDLASLPGDERHEVVRRQMAASLGRLARCREGQFLFQGSAQLPHVVGGRTIAAETLHPGLDVVEVLLEISWKQDEAGRHSTPPPAPLAESPAEPGGGLSVLLVDDEEPVRHLLSRYLVEGGYQVVEAGDVDSAVRRGASLGEAGIRFVLVTDLNMPDGDSFLGGCEVVKRLAMMHLRPPVVMMADGATSSLRKRQMRGVWYVVRKPGLSKLDPDEFEADLRALAGTMVREVLPRVRGALPA
jgi:CheY-like chemotaxis protein